MTSVRAVFCDRICFEQALMKGFDDVALLRFIYMYLIALLSNHNERVHVARSMTSRVIDVRVFVCAGCLRS